MIQNAYQLVGRNFCFALANKENKNKKRKNKEIINRNYSTITSSA